MVHKTIKIMNTNTNMVYKDIETALGFGEKEKDLKQVPDKLQNAANRVLKKEDRAHVSVDSGGMLSKWAALNRRKKSKKRRMQKQSRKANR